MKKAIVTSGREYCCPLMAPGFLSGNMMARFGGTVVRGISLRGSWLPSLRFLRCVANSPAVSDVLREGFVSVRVRVVGYRYEFGGNVTFGKLVGDWIP